MTTLAIPDTSRPIDIVLSRLEGVRRSGDGYTARCPAHDDRQASLSIGEGKDGEVLLHCFAGCETEAIVSSLGLTLADLYPRKEGGKSGSTPPVHKITVEELARDKGLPVELLKSVGVEQGIGGVKISYKLMDGKPAQRQRWRFALKAKEGSRWLGKKHDPIVPYGLWMLAKMRQKRDVLLLVEGESDCWTLWHYGIPALGIPGADMSKTLELSHVEMFPNLCVFKEPDNGGETFAAGILNRLTALGYQGRVRVTSPDGFKDPNDLHKSDPECFLARLGDLMDDPEYTEFIDDLSSLPAREAKKAIALASDEAENLTDLGNARRLVRHYGQDIRYCHPWDKWLIWDGRRWDFDSTGDIVRRAKATVAAMYQEASELEDSKERQRLVSHALKSESDSRLRAMIRLAESEPGIPVRPEDFDADPWLLNVENGTLDLRSGTLRSHSQEDLITKMVPVCYDADVACSLWEAFLNRAMGGNQDLVSYLQRVVGYTLTGDTREQCLFLLHGKGANGKSTFLETLRALLGDLSQQANFSTFLYSKDDKIRNDIARLRGARMVAAVEADAGRRLAESLVKQLTGQDTVTARFLFKEEFEYKPTFKVFLAANVKPVIRGQDNAIWRRIRLIPFEVTIPKEEQDKELGRKLQEELPGVLAWAVRGCQEWQSRGLAEPGKVIEATDKYRQDQDVLAAFLAECCVAQRTARVLSKSLYDAYSKYCFENAEGQLSMRDFGLALKDKGFDQTRTGQARGWLGLTLIDHDHQGALVGEAPDGDEAARIKETETADKERLPLGKEPF